MFALGPAGANAEPQRKFRVGTLFATSPVLDEPYMRQFKNGMKELGYVEGENVEYVHRWAEGRLDLVPALTKELVKERVQVILTGGITVAKRILAAEPSVPLVMAGGFDPVAEGLAKSLARPGGRLTGVVNLSDELTRKHLELIRGLLPRSRRVGVLCNPKGAPTQRLLAELERAAKPIGLVIFPMAAESPEAVASVVLQQVTHKPDAVIVVASPVFNSARLAVVEQLATLRVPIVYPDSSWTLAGGLVSYGPSKEAIFHRAARYVDKILKGASPGDLPIEQPTRFEMVINMKTARALSVKIPPELLMMADRVIE
jgi:putative ABC transport system substrate-binding protein